MSTLFTESLASLFGGVLPPEVIAKKSLRGMDLSGVRFRYEENRFPLERVRLPGWDLREANLQGCDLSYVDLSGSDLRGANLKGAKFGGSDSIGDVTRFKNADLRGACLDDVMGPCKFDGADCRGATFRNAKLGFEDEARVPRSSSFRRVDLRGAILDGGMFKWCVFDSANLEGASFRSADLAAAALWDVSAMNSDFQGACLRNLWLRERRLPTWRFNDPGVFWIGAKLDGANISETDEASRFFRYADGLEWVSYSRFSWLTRIPVIGNFRFLWHTVLQTKAMVSGSPVDPVSEHLA